MPEEPIGEWLISRLEMLAEEKELDKNAPTQEFADQVRQLRQQLGLSVDEFCARYDIPTAEVITAELSRCVKPSFKMRLLIKMIKADPKRVAEIVERARKRPKP